MCMAWALGMESIASPCDDDDDDDDAASEQAGGRPLGLTANSCQALCVL